MGLVRIPQLICNNIENVLKEGDYMTVGEKIAQCRDVLGMSQRQLAKKSGLTSPAICQNENDKRIPDLKCFVAICKTLEVKTDKFLKDVDI